MRVILKEDIASLGALGSIVKIKPGYGRNYLIPKGLAVMADMRNRKELAHHQKVLKAKRQRLLLAKRELCQQIEALSLEILKQVGEEDRIFGSVTTAELAALLEQKGHSIPKKDILLEEEIRKTGLYYAKVKLHPEVHAKLKFWVHATE